MTQNKRVAIILLDNQYTGEYDDDYQMVVRSITNWNDVTPEEYSALQAYTHKKKTEGFDFRIIEQVTTEFPVFLSDAVHYGRQLRAQKEAEEVKRKAKIQKRQEEAEAKRKQAEAERLQKIEETERQLFEELTKKYGK